MTPGAHLPPPSGSTPASVSSMVPERNPLNLEFAWSAA